MCAEKQINDPTKPALYSSDVEEVAIESGSISKQRLTAIFIRRNTRNAIINDTFYKKGDYVSGRKIISIESGRVILKNSQGTTQLNLISPIKKLKN